VNLRAAAITALELGEDEAVIELVWDVIVYYFIRDAVSDPESWMARVGAAGRPLDEVLTAKLRSLQTLLRLFRGDHEDVHEPLESALAVFTERRMNFEAAVALKELAFVRYLLDDDPQAAIAGLEEASRLFDSVNHDWGVALTETMLGTVLVAVGDTEAAETHHRHSLARSRRIDNEPLMAQALQQLAVIRVLNGQPDDALDLLDEAAHLLRGGRYQTDTTYTLDVLAAVALARDDAETAARAVAVAESVRTRLGTTVWPTVQALVASLTELVRLRLGEDTFEAVSAEAGAHDLFETLDGTLAAVRRSLAPVGS
jgi:tetratricopeptide (TPR) repeat protein